MKKPPPTAGENPSQSEELTGLESALAKAYARLRERARLAWEQRQAGKKDVADTIISVRITGGGKISPTPAPLLLPKRRKPRPKTTGAKRRPAK